MKRQFSMGRKSWMWTVHILTIVLQTAASPELPAEQCMLPPQGDPDQCIWDFPPDLTLYFAKQIFSESSWHLLSTNPMSNDRPTKNTHLILGKTSELKKRFLSGIARIRGGGVYPCPNFLALFQEVHFWSIKRVYFFKNANVLNF